MKPATKNIYLLCALLTIALVAAMATLRGQGQQGSPSVRQEKDDERFGPVVDYIAPVPIEKLAASNRYNDRYLKEDPRVEEASTNAEWVSNLPAFPVTFSDAIVLGEVAGAKAYMSGDKTGVYSEFTIRIDDVFKNDNQTPLAVGSFVAAEREGGRIRFPSGHILRYKLSNQNMPRIGRKYILFLQRADHFLERKEQEPTLLILTGYELRAGRVFPLDGVEGDNTHRGGHKLPQFAAYEDADATTFLKSVKEAITQSLQTSPAQGR